MEAIALPVSFVVLVWVFGGLLAAALPLAVGVFAIARIDGGDAVARAVTEVSIFALNLILALGLALAIDYTLLIVSRYRDELAGGASAGRGAAAHHVHRGTHGAVLGGHRCAVDGLDGVLPDALPEVVRLRRRRRGGVRGAGGDRGHAGGAWRCSGSALDSWMCAAWLAVCCGRAEPQPRPVDSGVLVPVDESRDAPARFRSVWRSSVAGRSGCAVPGHQVGLSRTTGCCRSRPRRASWVTRCATSFDVNALTDVTVVVPDADRTDAGGAGATMPRELSRMPDVTAVCVAGWRLADGPAADRRPRQRVERRQRVPDRHSRRRCTRGLRNQLDRLHAVHASGRTGNHVRRSGPDQQGHREGVSSRLPFGARADRHRHLRADVPAHRQRRVAAEDVGAQHAVVERRVRRAGVDLPGRPPRWARHHDRPERWSPACRCCCSAWRLGCRWTTRCS